MSHNITDISDQQPDTHNTPRSRHVNKDGTARFTNKLTLESSPYLLQHAHNPVNWLPWGREAFDRARLENKPLFVSIGYSTCHWCHVMEEESFEDLEIADFLNTHFIPVKVDREEMPDVDAVYMAAVQALNGNGGWPLNVFMTPDAKPFFGGTYFPARDRDRGAFTGFLTLLKNVANAYTDNENAVLGTADRLTDRIRGMLTPLPGHHVPAMECLDHAVHFFKHIYDPVYGGIQGAPKFPATLPIRFLLRMFEKNGDQELKSMAVHTLEKMAQGGMYDQIGGGFHRYSTDDAWLVPHFEKMLYDNALLSRDYLEAYRITGNEDFKLMVCEVLDYMVRELRAPQGGFYSATDADSLNDKGEKKEGFFFTWTLDEIDRILNKKQADIFKLHYSTSGKPDFEGRYIPHITQNPIVTAQKTGLSLSGLHDEIRAIKTILYNERSKRHNPQTDTKILTAWNGLAISAFACAGRIFDQHGYIETAQACAEFIINHHYSNNRLFRCVKGKGEPLAAFLDDYAYFEAGLMDLYEADHDRKWLTMTINLDSAVNEYHEDPVTGGFFTAPTDHEFMIAKEKPGHDSALPSPNSTAIMNLLRIHSYTRESSLMTRVEKALSCFSPLMENSPGYAAEMLAALDEYDKGRWRA